MSGLNPQLKKIIFESTTKRGIYADNFSWKSKRRIAGRCAVVADRRTASLYFAVLITARL